MIRYDNVTFLVCLPRSRSAWLAAFLKPVAWTMHDPLKRCESIDELGLRIDAILAAYPNQTVFVAETGTPLFYDPICARFPNAKFLFVERPVAEVMASLRREGVVPTEEFMQRYVDGYLRARAISRARHDMRLEVPFAEINARLLNIWRFVGNGLFLSGEYAVRMCERNIQVPIKRVSPTESRKARKLYASVGLDA